MNENVNKAYVLADALKRCRYTDIVRVLADLDKRSSWATERGMGTIIKFACGPDKAYARIRAFWKCRTTGAKIEAFSATVVRIVRRGCG